MAKGSLRVNGIIVDTDGEIKASTGDSIVIREDDGSAVITVDTNGKTSIGGPMDVGVDDTGHDVKFFGATSGSYMLWDESTDDLIVQGGNVGIGATLENWGGHSVLAIGTGGNLAGRNYDSSDTTIELTENSYSTGGNTDSLSKYIVNGEATAFRLQAGKHKFLVASSGTADASISWTTAMTIDNSGKVGIGTTAPAQLLDIVSATSSTIRMENTGDSGTTIIMDADRSAEDGGLGSVVFYWNGTAVASFGGQSGPDTANKDDGKLVFSTATSGGSRQVRMTIDDTGKVGIGTTAPAKILDIVGSTDNGLLEGVQITNTDYGVGEANQAIAINFKLSQTGTATKDAGRITVGKDDYWADNASADSHMTFKTRSSDTFTEHMRITSAGYVGIGTNNPSNMLDVRKDSTNVAIQVNTSNATIGNMPTSSEYKVTFVGGNAEIGLFKDGTDAYSYVIGTYNNSTDIPLIFRTRNRTERMRITYTGKVHVYDGAGNHKTSSAYFYSAGNSETNTGTVPAEFSVSGTSTSTRHLVAFGNVNGIVGSISVAGSATSFNTSSDYRLKENATPLIGAIDRINLLKPSRFNFIADPNITFDGFLAHEVSDIVPVAVTGKKDAVDKDGKIVPQGIDHSKLVPLLVASVQELSAKNDVLEEKVKALESAG